MGTIHKPWEIGITIYESESELLSGLQHHDAMACTCLLKAFAPRLLRFARRLADDDDEAEDILQESLIAACAHIEDFEGRSGLGTWLHRIVLNTVLRRRRRVQPAMVSMDGMASDSVLTDGQGGADGDSPFAGTSEEPDEIVLSHERWELVMQAVRALPDPLRAAFVLRDMEGLSTRVAAETLGIGEPALKVRLHRARQALRAALTPYLRQLEDSTTVNVVQASAK